MGRQSQLDTDKERLPDGITRVGYDADTGVYSYQDEEGNYWDGAPGQQYGTLRRVRTFEAHSSQAPKDQKSEPITFDSDPSDDQNSIYDSVAADKNAFGEKEGHRMFVTPREQKQIRPRSGTFSSLAGYFRRTQAKLANTNFSREASLPTPPKDENTPEKMTAPKRAVTFDQILGKGMKK